MAIYHLSAKIIGRSSGRDSTAASAYRAGEKIKDERTGLTHNYLSRKNDVITKGIFMPDNSNWNPNRSELWNTIEAKNKRHDAQTAREIEVALPAELTNEERWELVSEFSKILTNRYSVSADVVIHAPKENNNNYHAHILFSTDMVVGNTFGNKNRQMNDRNELEQIRKEWEVLTNKALEKAGYEVRIDCRTLEAQGIIREATQHEGVAATAMERKGIKTRVRKENNRRRVQEQERQDIEKELKEIENQIDNLNQQSASTEAHPSEPTLEVKPEPEIVAPQRGQPLIPVPVGSILHPDVPNVALRIPQNQPEKAKDEPTVTEDLASSKYAGMDVDVLQYEINRLDKSIKVRVIEVIEQKRNEFIRNEADKIQYKQTRLTEAYNTAVTEVQEHEKNKPAEPRIPRFFAIGMSKKAWENLDKWEIEYKGKKIKKLKAWSALGGNCDDLKDNREVVRRGSREYVEAEAAKKWNEESVREQAQKQVEKEYLEKYKELNAMRDELKKREQEAEAAANTPEAIRDRRIAELDDKLNNPPYWIGSAGYPEREAIKDANELIRLEAMKLFEESNGKTSRQEADKAIIEKHPVILKIRQTLERGMER